MGAMSLWAAADARDGTSVQQTPHGPRSRVRPVLILVRHGCTALNAGGRLRGRLDPPLDDVGRAQALRLGETLASMGPTSIVSSPLRRAVETAEPIASHAGLTVRLDARLLDRDYGLGPGSRSVT